VLLQLLLILLTMLMMLQDYPVDVFYIFEGNRLIHRFFCLFVTAAVKFCVDFSHRLKAK